MVNPTNYELKFIAKNRGIKNYQNMSREELLSTLDKSEHIIKNLSKNGLERIARNRRINNCKNMSKEDLLVALLKSNKSRIELRRSEDNNAEIKKTIKIFNERRNNFPKLEIKKIRTKFRYMEKIGEYLKELEQKDTPTEQEKQEKNRYTKRLQKVKKFLKKLKEKLNRLERY